MKYINILQWWNCPVCSRTDATEKRFSCMYYEMSSRRKRSNCINKIAWKEITLNQKVSAVNQAFSMSLINFMCALWNALLENVKQLHKFFWKNDEKNIPLSSENYTENEIFTLLDKKHDYVTVVFSKYGKLQLGRSSGPVCQQEQWHFDKLKEFTIIKQPCFS